MRRPGVMASYAMALVFAWAVAWQKSLWPGLCGAAGLALGLGLAAFYLVPAAYEQRWVNIGQVLSSGLQPAQNFLYTAINDPEHTFFNWVASQRGDGAGGGDGNRGGGSAAACGDGGRRRNAANCVDGAMEHGAGVGCSGNAADVARVQYGVDGAAQAAVLCSFRGAGCVCWRVCYAFILACAFGRRGGWLLMALAALCTVGTAAVLVHTTWWDSEDLPTLRAAIAAQTGFDGTDEYDPAGDDHYNIPASVQPVEILFDEGQKHKLPDVRMVVRRWDAENKEVTVQSSADVRLALRLLNYPAWQVEVNGVMVTPGRTDEIARMVVPLRAGTSQVRVRFARTPDRAVGAGISLASMALLISLLAGGWRRKANGEAAPA